MENSEKMDVSTIQPFVGAENDEAARELLVASYAECFTEKRHYDLLSWTIGAAVVLVTGIVCNVILSIPHPDTGYSFVRLGLGIFALIMVAAWWSIYERNRFWCEVCNETARCIERSRGISGLGLAYMHGGLKKRVLLQNTDEAGRKVGEQRAERTLLPSMHYFVRTLIVLLAFGPLVLAVSSTVVSTKGG